MKNIIMGTVCGLIMLYSILTCMSIYGNISRKNEMEHILSRAVTTVLKQSYGTKADETQVRALLSGELVTRIASDSQFEIAVRVCDTDKGILSVCITEKYRNPFGIMKQREYEKTAIVEQEG